MRAASVSGCATTSRGAKRQLFLFRRVRKPTTVIVRSFSLSSRAVDDDSAVLLSLPEQFAQRLREIVNICVKKK